MGVGSYRSILRYAHQQEVRLIALLRREWAFALLCGIFIMTLGFFACVWSPHQINPDATAYFSIAEKYARLDLHGAVNGYWGPLLSWLLVPFVWLGIGLDAAARGITVVAAAATLAAVYYFWRVRNLSRAAAVSFCLALAALLAGWVLVGATSPDMIFTFLVTVFVVYLDKFLVAPTSRVGIRLGAIGAGLYFAKGFGFYLFIIIVGTMLLWQWWRTGWARKPLRPYRALFICFAVLVLPFVLVLSLKYHAITINTTGSYVHRVFGPQLDGAHPSSTQGPIAPPNATASTIWEDPSLLLPRMQDWSPLGSAANLSYFWHKVVLRNLEATLTYLHDMGALCEGAVLLLLVGCLGRGVGCSFRREYMLLTVVCLLMVMGYALVLTEARYLWPAVVLAIMGLGLWAVQLEQKRLLSRVQVVVIGLIVAWLYMLPLPAKLQDSHLSATELYVQAVQGLGPQLPPHTKVIADNFLEYHPCYYLQLSCYAVLQTPAAGTEALYYQDLKRAGITYFVDYHTRDADSHLQDFIGRYFTEEGVVSTSHTHPLTPLRVTLYRLR